MVEDRDYSQMLRYARKESVNRSEEEAIKRQIRVERKKRAKRIYRIQGAIAAIAISAIGFFTIPNVVGAFNDYSNTSYIAGYNTTNNEIHRTESRKDFWFDYGDIARDFDEDMDFDSYVYGCYVKIANSGSGRTLINMNDLFNSFYNYGLTPYRTFDDYCLAHGFVKEKDGKLVTDLGAYSKGAKDYLEAMKTVEEVQQDIQSFRSK